jgi:rhodanese-related sulfurtransferase
VNLQKQKGPIDMPDDLRITIDELKKRMEAGEDFALIDTRNPQAWAQSDVMLPEAVRVPVDDLEQHLYEIPKNKPIVTYCT